MKVNVYIANLGAYNRGYLVGKWVSLPTDEDILQEEINEVLNGNEAIKTRDFKDQKDEEWAIHDYEAPFEISEYENVFALNEKLNNLPSHIDEEVVRVIVENADCLDDAFSIMENEDFSVYYDVRDMEDIAREFIEETGLLEEMGTFQNYFDFKAYGRDMGLEGTFWFGNNLCVEILR